MAQNAKAEIERLRETIRRHDLLYYVEARPEISDLEYDHLMKQLEKLEQEHPEFDSPDSPTHRVSGEPLDGFNTVPHRVPMLSIDNVYEADAVFEWEQRVRKLLGEEPQPEYTVEYKIDGVALALVYENGSLVQGVTRGDGQQGDDITQNARTLRGVPLKLLGKNLPPVLEVRGEAFISNSDFAHFLSEQEKRGEQPFANPRNAAAGALKLLDARLCAARKLRFFAHGIGYSEGFEIPSHAAFVEALHEMGLVATPGIRSFKTIEAAMEYAQELMEGLHSLDFEVDGLVFKVNEFALRDELGATGKSPRWVVAYKWEKYEAVTKVEEITIQVGKTGTLTPVAHLEPVQIAGTTVSRASLHNRDEIERLQVMQGDWVVVEKAGKIIPHVVRVEEHRRDETQLPFSFPTHCPECQTLAIQDEGGVYIRCPNPNCPAQLRETLRYFASRSAMDIDGLGIKLIEQLMEGNLLGSLPDVYRLAERRDELLQLERMGEKSLDNLLAGIEASKERPLWRLLTGLNIRHVGTTTARLLADRFGTLDELMNQSEESLADVEEIGPVIAHSVYSFFESEVGRQLVEELRQLGLRLGESVEANDATPSSKPLEGKTIVVTGTLQRFTRDGIKELIHKHGGKASGSVSKKTDYVVAGENAGSKLEKAQQLVIPVLSEAELVRMVEGE